MVLNNITGAKVGSSNVSKIYLGQTLVWPTVTPVTVVDITPQGRQSYQAIPNNGTTVHALGTAHIQQGSTSTPLAAYAQTTVGTVSPYYFTGDTMFDINVPANPNYNGRSITVSLRAGNPQVTKTYTWYQDGTVGYYNISAGGTVTINGDGELYRADIVSNMPTVLREMVTIEDLPEWIDRISWAANYTAIDIVAQPNNTGVERRDVIRFECNDGLRGYGAGETDIIQPPM